MPYLETLNPANDNDDEPWWLIPLAFVLNPGLWLLGIAVGIKWLIG